MVNCFLYAIETMHGHIYCGVTENFRRRLKEHITGKGGAKYTSTNGVYCIRMILLYEDKAEAMGAEKVFKKLGRKQKEDYVNLDKNKLITKQWINVFRYQYPMTKEEEKVYNNSI
jgi:putative endonuclease